VGLPLGAVDAIDAEVDAEVDAGADELTGGGAGVGDGWVLGGALDGGALDGGADDGGALDGGALDGGAEDGGVWLGLGECVGLGVWLGAGTASTTRVAPKNADHQTVAILTWSPVVGASTILPPPR
jgi:hypothetical protein